MIKYEGQILKLKNFKIVLKYATTLQCANCNRFISTAMFVDHLRLCLPQNQNPFMYTGGNSAFGIDDGEDEEEMHHQFAIEKDNYSNLDNGRILEGLNPKNSEPYLSRESKSANKS